MLRTQFAPPKTQLKDRNMHAIATGINALSYAAFALWAIASVIHISKGN